MPDENARTSDRFDLSLDGRQIASIVVGALVLLGVVFVLGLNVGRQLAGRDPVAGGGDALAALDQAPAAPAEPLRDEELTYGKTLSGGAPAPAPKATPAAAPAQPPPATAVADAPTSTPNPTSNSTPTATPTPTPAPTPRPSIAATITRPPATSSSGAWTVQLGSAQDRVDATRIAKRFDRYHPRVESADLGAKGRWFRVRVGRYPSREAAERFLRDLQRETGAKGFVTSAQ